VRMSLNFRQWRGLLISLSLLLLTSIGEAKTILIVAPHPDDEALCCSGIIDTATERGDTVYVVVLTNGDAFQSGLQREGETVTAMGLLGVPEQQIIFLGYGDGLTLTLYESNNPNQVYKSLADVSATYGNRGHYLRTIIITFRAYTVLTIARR
jgi:LmbE family N-acetylglucosaminyl deacetylase